MSHAADSSGRSRDPAEDRHRAVLFLDPLTEAFAKAGKRLYLVGGIVRGIQMGAYSTDDDLDLTTDARPSEVKEIIADVVSSVWTQGESFGTIGARFKGRPVEITTHRAESYNSDSRKPVVQFGDDLETDLSRRDFTINAMALSLPDGSLVDPYGGRSDLTEHRLATPLDPSISFGDDPLRILRAARFISRFDLTPAPELHAAAKSTLGRLDIVSIERIQIEIELLLSLDSPGEGLKFLSETGVLKHIFGAMDSDASRLAASVPGLSALLRRCALLGHAGPDRTKEWLQDHRYSTDERQLTTAIVRAAHSLRSVNPSPADVRSFVANTGLDRLPAVFALARLRPDIYANPNDIETVVAALADSEDLSDLGSPLSGAEIMEVLEIGQSRAVGAATNYLASKRIQDGPLTKTHAIELIKTWWGENN